jgi:hypothetical protein
VWRLLDLLDEVGLKASVSTNGLAAERHPGAVRAVAEAGHEIVGHGWVNDILTQDDDPEGELAEHSARGVQGDVRSALCRGPGGQSEGIEMTLHCHMAGRPTLFPTIRRCIEYAKQHVGVVDARKRDIAEWTLAREGKAATDARTSAAIPGV